MMKTMLKATTQNLKDVLSKFENSIVTIETKHTSHVLENFDWIVTTVELECFDMNNEGYRFKVARSDLKAIIVVDDDFISIVLNNESKINLIRS